ncbi:GNAT family N-acetyltransferase [Sinanaerobacter sp. ZZT-01]|uniref:GNAT family N-acetyltransferase n=1 Tax=Sinanaerobacter sp. ZZT-01 TaxID=3111540 RepID=UPI002D786666|nr:GNAT family N-acetyltransferase [Sinanaerobacter sp. ZZT-01]WRR93256.1 GNAT family N-acetyltransferase [Sinanaerobacter sp. ZZT-01]
MILRAYRPEDCAFMARLFYDTVHTINARDYTNEQLDAWATGDVDLNEWNHSLLENDTLIAEIDGKIVGFADMEQTGYLNRLYIHKEYQRKGIAAALVNELEQRAKVKGLFNFETDASITAKPFFEKQGYMVKTKQEVIRSGIILVNYKMTKFI